MTKITHCRNCIYFIKGKEDNKYGNCFLNPPKVVAVTNPNKPGHLVIKSVRPSVNEDNFCSIGIDKTKCLYKKGTKIKHKDTEKIKEIVLVESYGISYRTSDRITNEAYIDVSYKNLIRDWDIIDESQT